MPGSRLAEKIRGTLGKYGRLYFPITCPLVGYTFLYIEWFIFYSVLIIRQVINVNSCDYDPGIGRWCCNIRRTHLPQQRHTENLFSRRIITLYMHTDRSLLLLSLLPFQNSLNCENPSTNH